MKYAFVKKFDESSDYCFNQLFDEKIEGDFPYAIWVELPDDTNISSKTHKYTDQGFVERPKPRVKQTVTAEQCVNTDEATVL